MTAVDSRRGLIRGAQALVREMIATSPRQAVSGVFLLLLLAGTEGAAIVLLQPLLELIGVVDESPLPRASRWLRPIFAFAGVEPSLASVLGLFIGVSAVHALVLALQARVAATLRENLIASYRVRMYRALASAQWRFLVTRKPSQFMHMMVNELVRMGAAAGYIIELTVAVLIAIVYLVVAFRLSAPMALLVLGCAALLGATAKRSIDRARDVGQAAAAQRVRLHGAIAEHIAAMKLAKSYGVTDGHETRVAELAQDARRIGLEVLATEADLNRLLEVGSTVLLAIVVYLTAVWLEQSSAVLLIMLFIFARLMPRLLAVYRYAQALASNLPVFESIRALEAQCAAEAESEAPTHAPIVLRHAIRLDNVSFTYANRDTPALDRLTLDIRAGTTTAIVGPSGSGKSTLADLLLGLLAPDSGTFNVDGERLGAEHLRAWREQVGYVSQDTFLFDDTVRANLLWACPGASDEEIQQALRMASAETFVAALPQRLDTVIGDRGILLSGGERQRLAIARALLRQPRVLILDEATSALDADNEQRIQQAIESLHHRMTIVIITHRLSAIQHADVIHVMRGGRIVSRGTWAELRRELLLEELLPS